MNVVDFEKKVGVMINDLKSVCKATGVPEGALKKIIKEKGAYYSRFKTKSNCSSEACKMRKCPFKRK